MLEFVVEIRVLNPYAPEMDVAVIQAKASTNVSFTVNDNLTLFGSVNHMRLDIVDFTPYFQTKTTTQNIN